MENKNLNVVCVKQGSKYESEYVNKLYNMVQRNCSLDYNFFCVTDDAKKISKEINTLELPKDIKGWWSKLYLFSKNLPIEGTILYFDLDVVISNNIDCLFSYSPENWCIIRDFSRSLKPSWKGFNSSVMRFEKGENHEIWDFYKKNKEKATRNYPGDQELIFHNCDKNIPAFWPDNWIQSWKWEIRSNKDIDRSTRKGQRKFKKIEETQPPEQCSVVVFHGDPTPANCKDPWVVKNWV